MGAWEWIVDDLRDVLPNLTSRSFHIDTLTLPQSSLRAKTCTSPMYFQSLSRRMVVNYYLLIESLPERREAEMVRGVLLHMLLHLDGRGDRVSGLE